MPHPMYKMDPRASNSFSLFCEEHDYIYLSNNMHFIDNNDAKYEKLSAASQSGCERACSRAPIFFHTLPIWGSILSYPVCTMNQWAGYSFSLFCEELITFTYLIVCISLLIMLLKMVAIIVFVSFDPQWWKLALNLKWSIDWFQETLNENLCYIG